MSRQSFFTSSGIIFRTLSLSALIFSSVCAYSQSVTSGDETSKNAVIRYLGSDEEMFIFNVQYNNVLGDKFILEINDNSGNALFRSIYSDRVFYKKFKIPKEIGKLNFTIKNIKDKSKYTFLVDSNIRTYEDVVISRVN